MRSKPLSELLLIAFLLTPFVYAALIWNQLPNTLPGHFGADGRPNRYDPKGELAGLMGATTLLFYLAFRLLPRFDPRANLNSTLYQKIRWLVMGFWAAFMGWFWTISWQGVSPDGLTNGILIGVGLLVTGLGNLLNSIKPNYFVGIRTPWTLESETVWRKTHRLGGRLMVAGGLLSVVLTLTVPLPYIFGVVIGVVMMVALIPVIFSYVYFRREKARQLS